MIPEIDLDRSELGSLLSDISNYEEKKLPLVTMVSSVNEGDKIRAMLSALRASNISGILLLKRSGEPLEDEEVLGIFAFLREWDQLLLLNVLELAESWIPQVFLAPLQQEAKVELKWFKEWLTASSDARIHKYPGLPWRRFIRKIISENYIFTANLAQLIALPATEENVRAVGEHFNRFLEEKRKVVSLFPKRWEKIHEH